MNGAAQATDLSCARFAVEEPESELRAYSNAVRAQEPGLELLSRSKIEARVLTVDDKNCVQLTPLEGHRSGSRSGPVWIDIATDTIGRGEGSATPDEELAQVKSFVRAVATTHSCQHDPLDLHFINVREFSPDATDPKKVVKTKLHMVLCDGLIVTLRDGPVTPITRGLHNQLAVPLAHPLGLAAALVEGVVDPLDGVVQSLERHQSRLVNRNAAGEHLTAEETNGLAVFGGTVSYLHQRTLTMLSATKRLQGLAARELARDPGQKTGLLVSSLDVLSSSIDVYVTRCKNLNESIALLMGNVQTREQQKSREAQEQGNAVLEMIRNRGGLLAAMAVPIGLGMTAVRTFDVAHSWWGSGIMAFSVVVAGGLILFRNKRIPWIDAGPAPARR